MKILTTMALAITLLTLSSWKEDPKSSKVEFYSGTYDNFLREAKKQHKPILLDFWAGWCAPCKKMDAETFGDKDFASYLNENFLVYKVNIDSFEGMEIVQRFDVKAFPTLLIGDSKGNEVTQLKGFYMPNYLKKTLENLNEEHQLYGEAKKDQYVMN